MAELTINYVHALSFCSHIFLSSHVNHELEDIIFEGQEDGETVELEMEASQCPRKTGIKTTKKTLIEVFKTHMALIKCRI